MTGINKHIIVNLKSEFPSKKETEILKNKLKLDNKIIGLLVNSRGSIKNKSFIKKVSEQIKGI